MVLGAALFVRFEPNFLIVVVEYIFLSGEI
jgi:hypothetical protein